MKLSRSTFSLRVSNIITPANKHNEREEKRGGGAHLDDEREKKNQRKQKPTTLYGVCADGGANQTKKNKN